MAEVEITRELSPTKGRYVGRVAGIDGEAELTYSRASPTLVIADHTFAPDSMRGKGVARALLDRLIADARSEGFKIIPLCPYVKSQYQRHPEWSDVMQG
ncbi:MAG: GNAT family N-acetyltransferase [Hyphomicrobiaceae bacterium]